MTVQDFRKKNILTLFDRFGFDQYFGRTGVMETLSMTVSTASALIVSDLIILISSRRKGKINFPGKSQTCFNE